MRSPPPAAAALGLEEALTNNELIMVRRNASELIMDITAMNNWIFWIICILDNWWVDDGDGGGGGRISGRARAPIPIASRDHISRSGSPPHSDDT